MNDGGCKKNIRNSNEPLSEKANGRKWKTEDDVFSKTRRGRNLASSKQFMRRLHKLNLRKTLHRWGLSIIRHVRKKIKANELTDVPNE